VRPARALDLLIPDNPSGHVDGILTGGALLAAESTRRETLLESAGAVALALVLVWLAHSYSAFVGHRLERDGRAWSSRQLVRMAAHEFALLRGAFIPLGVLIVAGLIASSAKAAVIAALISAVVLLLTFEIVAAVRARLTVGALAVQAGFGVALGAGVLALKVVLG
jgi:hypothetical protein